MATGAIDKMLLDELETTLVLLARAVTEGRTDDAAKTAEEALKRWDRGTTVAEKSSEAT